MGSLLETGISLVLIDSDHYWYGGKSSDKLRLNPGVRFLTHQTQYIIVKHSYTVLDFGQLGAYCLNNLNIIKISVSLLFTKQNCGILSVGSGQLLQNQHLWNASGSSLRTLGFKSRLVTTSWPRIMDSIRVNTSNVNDIETKAKTLRYPSLLSERKQNVLIWSA